MDILDIKTDYISISFPPLQILLAHQAYVSWQLIQFIICHRVCIYVVNSVFVINLSYMSVCQGRVKTVVWAQQSNPQDTV